VVWPWDFGSDQISGLGYSVLVFFLSLRVAGADYFLFRIQEYFFFVHATWN
jgi:hypothetical protein